MDIERLRPLPQGRRRFLEIEIVQCDLCVSLSLSDILMKGGDIYGSHQLQQPESLSHGTVVIFSEVSSGQSCTFWFVLLCSFPCFLFLCISVLLVASAHFGLKTLE